MASNWKDPEAWQLFAMLILLILVGFSCYQSGYDAGLLAGT